MTQHRLDRRADLLGQKIRQRVEMLTDALGGSFRKPLPRSEAIAWWRKHRYDELGMAVLANLGAQDVLDLDVSLSQAIEEDSYGPTG